MAETPEARRQGASNCSPRLESPTVAQSIAPSRSGRRPVRRICANCADRPMAVKAMTIMNDAA
jgi:hypothetical protein